MYHLQKVVNVSDSPLCSLLLPNSTREFWAAQKTKETDTTNESSSERNTAATEGGHTRKSSELPSDSTLLSLEKDLMEPAGPTMGNDDDLYDF